MADMKAYNAEDNPLKRDEIAARQVRVLNERRRPRDLKMRLVDVKKPFRVGARRRLRRSGFALLQVLFRAAQLHRDSSEQRLSDHLRAILRVRHGDVGATRDSFGDLRLRHDTARFERVARRSGSG
jgi:hypothetical protein